MNYKMYYDLRSKPTDPLEILTRTLFDPDTPVPGIKHLYNYIRERSKSGKELKNVHKYQLRGTGKEFKEGYDTILSRFPKAGLVEKLETFSTPAAFVQQWILNTAKLPQPPELSKAQQLLSMLSISGIAAGTGIAGSKLLEKKGSATINKNEMRAIGRIVGASDVISSWLPAALAGVGYGIVKGLKGRKNLELNYIKNNIENATYLEKLFGQNILMAKDLKKRFGEDIVKNETLKTIKHQLATGAMLGAAGLGVKYVSDSTKSR